MGIKMNDQMAFLIIDAQVNMFADEMRVYAADRLVETISTLAERARRSGIPVIFVRNNGGKEDPDEPGTPGWEIYPALAPRAGELVIDKAGPDAFEATSLQQTLRSSGVGRLVLSGMQTELCIDTTCRKALELGYQVIVVEDGHSTFDFKEVKAVEAIEKYNREWGRIATVQKAVDIRFE
jgi:nicotinamidase-related amidase